MDLLKKIKKVCEANEDCTTCPLNGESWCSLGCAPVLWNVEETNEVVNHWLELHAPKTVQSEVLKILPDIPMDNGVLLVCHADVYVTGSCRHKNCFECRKEFWLKEIE